MIRKAAMTPDDAATLALQALVWILGDEDRAARLLALTGLDAGMLRERAGERATHEAILDYLVAHEPDLVACAEALAISPELLAEAQQQLSGRPDWG